MLSGICSEYSTTDDEFSLRYNVDFWKYLTVLVCRMIMIGGSCFYISSRPLTHENAEAHCSDHWSRLAYIESEDIKEELMAKAADWERGQKSV